MDKPGCSGRLGGGQAEPTESRSATRTVCPGVTSVKRKTKHVYQIAFSYMGVECREIVAIESTKGNDKYCERLRSEILGKIERECFVYTDYFPDSKRAKVFGLTPRRDAKFVKEALKEYKTRIERTLSSSTYAGYRKSIDNVLIPRFGNYRFPELTTAVLRAWVVEQSTSMKRIQNNLLPLRTVVEEAFIDGQIKENPFARLKISKLVSPSQRSTDYEPDPYTEDEIITLLSAIDERDRWVFQAWAYTGVRTGEVVGLRWPRVDLDANFISIVETTTERKDKDRPKTEAGRRSMNLLPGAREAFDRMRPRTQLGGDRVFINDRSTRKDKAWDDKKLAGVWKRAHKGTGIRYRNPYQLRHTFASNLLTQGENPALIARMLGHKNAEMVIRVYAKQIERGAALGFDRPPRTYGMRRLWDSAAVSAAN